MRFFLILGLLLALRVESTTIYVDNVHLGSETELAIPTPSSTLPDEEIEVIFRNSAIETFSKKITEKFPQAYRLVVSGCKIEQIDATSRKAVKNLKDLDLSWNKIKQLMSHQFKWVNRLKKLNLSHNSIASMETGAFADLTKLTELDLSFNQLTAAAEGVFRNLAAMTSLNLDQNSLVRIDTSMFQGIENLNAIFLAGNDISNVTAQAFNQFKQLKILQLSDNVLGTFVGITLPQGIEYLNLEDNELESVDFDDYPSLRNLSLSKNRILWRPSMFDKLTKLIDLKVSETNLSATVLSGGLLQRLESLASLDLSINPLKELDISTMPVLNQLTQLNLEECQLTKLENFEDIAQKFPALERLVVMNNFWDCQHVDRLTMFLENVAVIAEDGCKRTSPSDKIGYLREAESEITERSTEPMLAVTFPATYSSIESSLSSTTSEVYSSDNPATVTSTTEEDEVGGGEIDLISTSQATINGDDDDVFDEILDFFFWIVIGVLALLLISIGLMIYYYCKKCRKTQKPREMNLNEM